MRSPALRWRSANCSVSCAVRSGLDRRSTQRCPGRRAARRRLPAGTHYTGYPSKRFKPPSPLRVLSPNKQPTIASVRRRSLPKGRCELGFWRSISKDDGRLIIKAAQQYEEHERKAGERIGPLGPEILKLFVNLAIVGDGRVEPQITWIMSTVLRSKCAVVAALSRLRDLGFIDWRRRYVLTGNEGLRRQVKHVSNAYRIFAEAAKRVPYGFERP